MVVLSRNEQVEMYPVHEEWCVARTLSNVTKLNRCLPRIQLAQLGSTTATPAGPQRGQ